MCRSFSNEGSLYRAFDKGFPLQVGEGVDGTCSEFHVLKFLYGRITFVWVFGFTVNGCCAAAFVFRGLGEPYCNVTVSS